ATAASNAYNTFHTEEQKALDKFKNDLLGHIDTYKAAMTDDTLVNQTSAKAQADKLKDIISNSNDFETISKAYGDFLDNTAVQTQTTGLTTFTNTNAKKALNDYATSVETAVGKARGQLAAYDQKGDVQTLDGLLDTYGQAATTAKTANADKAGLTTALGGAFTTFNTGAKPIGNKDVDFKDLDIANIGAANLAANAFTNGANPTTAKEITNLFEDLKTQTTLEGANSTIDKLTKKLEEVVNAAADKTMDTAEAQQGMVAHSYLQFFAGVKAGLNEPNNEGLSSIIGLNTTNSTNMGRLSLVSNNGRDIQVEVKDANGFTSNSALGFDKNVSEATVSLRETNATISRAQADAMGFNNEEWQAGDNGDNTNGYAAGVMTLKGAQAMMNIAESAQKALEAIRSDLGSVQNQLVSTVNNISVTQVNVKSAESNIRDVDFASESATFSKHQILAQSGVYAMSQANAVQQNVMRLLQ
ncbi:flagellin, partial [Campylobacter sp. 2018MI13]|uniref:flagellin n=2 Tax=unclassified Campylobacter TaxID=2593542 RepID=UPI001BDA7650